LTRKITSQASACWSPRQYLDNSTQSDRLSGGVRLILVTTAYRKFKVWTKRFGNNPRVKLLLLHGGPSELDASGKLAHWDRSADLCTVSVPAMTIGARHDTMDPQYMQDIASLLQRGCFLDCPTGSHMAMFDDQERYFQGVFDFLNDIDCART
jgi:hypothetical protein